MNEHAQPRPEVERARSFDLVVGAYDRARPGYPADAVRWLAGDAPARVLELGAGTGKLTAPLVQAGHTVTATDPSPAMLATLAARVPGARAAVGIAEQVPARTGSADVVVAGQAAHWFDLTRALPEASRVLRPGGTLALVWNQRDDRIPWVRRLSAQLESAGDQQGSAAVLEGLAGSGLFAEPESATFRFWQPLTKRSLADLVVSQSRVALLPEPERQRVLGLVDQLYDEYGRGPDGMLLPYVTRCYRAPALPRPEPADPAGDDSEDGLGTDALLIDFR